MKLHQEFVITRPLDEVWRFFSMTCSSRNYSAGEISETTPG